MWHSSFVLDESLWTVNIYNLERPNQYFLRIPFDPNLQSCPRQPPIGPLGIGLDINAPRVQYLYCDYREEFTKLEGGLKRSNANHPFPLPFLPIMHIREKCKLLVYRPSPQSCLALHKVEVQLCICNASWICSNTKNQETKRF